MAALPLDPRLARILVEGSRLGCLREMLIIVAALAIVDVREYPLEERDKATAAHSRFVDPTSDFSALLGLWVYLEDQAKALSGNAFRKMCRREYLNYLRIREWQDLHAQLRQLRPRSGHGRRADPPRRPGRASKIAADGCPTRRTADGTARRRSISAGPGQPRLAGRRGRQRRRCTPRCWPGCSRTSGCAARRAGSTRAPGASRS